MRHIRRAFLSVALLAGAASGSAAQQVADWSGFYAGVYAGYALGTANTTSETTGPVNVGGYVFDLASATTRIDGLIGGLGAGYAYQSGMFVLGIDGTVHMGSLQQGSTEVTSAGAQNGVNYDFNDLQSSTTANLDWYSTVTGSIGIAFEEDWLVSFKGGLAFGNATVRSASTFTIDRNVPVGIVDAPVGTYGAAGSTSQMIAGPTIGFGIEKKLAPNISLGAEYIYVGLPSANGTSLNAAAVALGTGATGTPYSVPMGFHTVNATLKYHF